ncbi:DUF2470 domain-containing protein [bacterium]|nr:DUF2470 domain-containing protein [bacterium]
MAESTLTEPTILDPLADIAANAIAHMNEDHDDTVLAYARRLAGLTWADSAVVTELDADGIEIAVRGNGLTQLVRIPFEPRLTEAAQLRPKLIEMAEQMQILVPQPVESHAPSPQRDDETAQRLYNVLSTRRSFPLKALLPEPIDLDLVVQVLEAANWAPSHGKTEPWRFVVFSGEARRTIGDAFGAAYRLLNEGDRYNAEGERNQRERVWQAPVWIALGMQPSPQMPEWEEVIAFGSAVQNLHLMTSALGLAGKWTSGATAIHPHVANVVGFDESTKLFGFFYLGQPAGEWPAGKRRSLAEKIRWER